MKKIILNQNQISLLIKANYYPVSVNNILCRCIDGRYGKNLNQPKSTNKTQSKKNLLPALTIPGGDIGQIAIILAAANNFGFEINKDKLLKTYEEFLSGWKNFHYHSDDQHKTSDLASGCGYYHLIKTQPDKFYLQHYDIDFIKKQINLISQQTKQIILHGDHDEGAVVLVKGEAGIYPRYIFTINIQGEEIKTEASVFVFNQTLFENRQRLLAKELIESNAVKLFSGLDDEYLSFTLIEAAETHLFETVNHLGQRLPIYKVIFDQSFRFQLQNFTK